MRSISTSLLVVAISVAPECRAATPEGEAYEKAAKFVLDVINAPEELGLHSNRVRVGGLVKKIRKTLNDLASTKEDFLVHLRLCSDPKNAYYLNTLHDKLNDLEAEIIALGHAANVGGHLENELSDSIGVLRDLRMQKSFIYHFDALCEGGDAYTREQIHDGEEAAAKAAKRLDGLEGRLQQAH